jgi:hypothetical protein
MAGLLEILAALGGREDLPDLAHELNFEVDDLLSLVDGVVLLGLARTAPCPSGSSWTCAAAASARRKLAGSSTPPLTGAATPSCSTTTPTPASSSSNRASPPPIRPPLHKPGTPAQRSAGG